MKQLASAVDNTFGHYPPFGGAAPTRRPIQISPPIRRVAQALVIWAAACLLLGGVGTLLHHNVSVTEADSALCKR
jgi:hypothetical protein